MLFLLRVRTVGLRVPSCGPKGPAGQGYQSLEVPRTGCKEVVSIGGGHGYVCGGNVLGLSSPPTVLRGGISWGQRVLNYI